jgi:branched-chain amino acid transport system substrate-binding protein
MKRCALYIRAILAVLVASSAIVVGAVSMATPATAASAPIIVGVVCSCTGPLASSTDIGPPAYRAWVSWVNANGGINGHKVSIIYKDDSFNPGTSLTEVKTMIEQDHAVAIVDGSDVDASWADYVKQQNVPVIGAASSSEPFFTNSDFYAEGQTEDQLFASIVGAAKKVKAKSLALFYCAEAATCQEGVAPLKATAAASGVPLVYNVSISASAPNYSAQCLAAKQAGAQALFIADAVSVVGKVASDCATQGYNPPIVLDGEVLAPSLATTAGVKKYAIFNNLNVPYYSTQVAGVKTMNAAFKKYQPSLLKSPNYSEIAVQTWVSGLLLTAAAKAGGLTSSATPTAKMLVTGLHTLRNNTLGGMAPPLTFKTGVPNPIDCWQGYAVLKNGKFSTPYGLKATCATSTS